MMKVLVFNAGGTQVLHTVDLMHAIRMLNRQVARVLDAVPGRSFGPHPLPRSVELVTYIYARWMYEATGRTAPSVENVLRRDRYRCGYCGRVASTRDHVKPVSHGGKTTWLNLVAACLECNGRKRDRTPKQAGMRLDIVPFIPTPADLWPKARVRR
ncbi:MAG: HNH endonuclease [Proteobacteria bacterium]|nr:HNH endonuclease [Pseudomonadota bacterium]MBU4188684.1 HNH endonuclease [Actinomycetota bacterium]MBU4418226.1 HNH endonuclease [Actinomycetota bacterium]MBU4587820.1 HNH endonuclease [Actinomycetota bacterium]